MMKTLMSLLVVVATLSFLGLPSAMATDGTPPAPQTSGSTDQDKDKHHHHHRRHHHRHHHHRHHKHPETSTNPTQPGTKS